MIMVIHSLHGMIMTRSWHGHHVKGHDHGVTVMEDSLIMSSLPLLLLLRSLEANYPTNFAN